MCNFEIFWDDESAAEHSNSDEIQIERVIFALVKTPSEGADSPKDFVEKWSIDRSIDLWVKKS